MTVDLSSNQTLLLFLIYCAPGMRNIQRMVQVFDRANFPSRVSDDLERLLNNEYIVTKAFYSEGKQPIVYAIAGKGKLYHKERFVKEDIVEYIKTMHSPDFLLQLVEGYSAKPEILKFEEDNL